MSPAELREYIDHMKGSVGWTYDELAKQIFLTRNTLYKYITGLRAPRDLDQLIRDIRQAVVKEQRRMRNRSKGV